MEPTKNTPLSLLITDADTELGQETIRQFVARGHQVTGLMQGQDQEAAVRSQGGLPAEANPTSATELKELMESRCPSLILLITLP